MWSILNQNRCGQFLPKPVQSTLSVRKDLRRFQKDNMPALFDLTPPKLYKIALIVEVENEISTYSKWAGQEMLKNTRSVGLEVEGRTDPVFKLFQLQEAVTFHVPCFITSRPLTELRIDPRPLPQNLSCISVFSFVKFLKFAHLIVSS